MKRRKSTKRHLRIAWDKEKAEREREALRKERELLFPSKPLPESFADKAMAGAAAIAALAD